MHEMHTVVLNLYQGSNDARKLVLKEKLREIHMAKGKPIASYLTKFTQVRDELARVNETISDNDLVSLALLGFHKLWDNFHEAVTRREKLPEWERLWSD